MIINRTIFIAPLDWGMGHASRCVPLIQNLKATNKVTIGVTTLSSDFFEQYFPDLQKVMLPSYTIRYSKVLPLWFKLAIQWPKIKKVIQTENKLLRSIIHSNKIDLVISDNRYGLYSDEVESVFISHQLNIKAPFFSLIINRIQQGFIHRFTNVWVPDFEDKVLRLSGILSDSTNIRIPVTYINPQSALSLFDENLHEKKIDYLILLSGIEPHRTLLEQQLIHSFSNTTYTVVLVRGVKKSLTLTNKNIEVIPFTYGKELRSLIVNAKTVICRSGYSTLMDLFLLNKKQVILFPTPGQSEQEYLADYWRDNFGAVLGDLKNLNIH